MGRPVRSKKMAFSKPAPDVPHGNWTYPAENGPHRPMADRIFRLDRRELMAAIGRRGPRPGQARDRRRPGPPVPEAAGQGRRHRLASGTTGYPDMVAPGPAARPRFALGRGDELEITLQNELPVPTVLNWHGIDGVAAAEPLAARSPLAGSGRENLVIPLRHAGTLLCDLRLLGDGQARPLPRAGAGRRGERARRRRPRRGVPDRGLAAPPGRNRDRARHRPRRTRRRSTPSTA